MNMSVYVYVAVVLSRVTKKYGNKAIRKEVVPRVVYPNEGRVYLGLAWRTGKQHVEQRRNFQFSKQLRLLNWLFLSKEALQDNVTASAAANSFPSASQQ